MAVKRNIATVFFTSFYKIKCTILNICNVTVYNLAKCLILYIFVTRHCIIFLSTPVYNLICMNCQCLFCGLSPTHCFNTQFACRPSVIALLCINKECYNMGE